MDLSLVPIQDLYEEILGRFDHAVFMGIKVGKDDSSYSRRWKGNHHMAMGLCSDLINEINTNIINSEIRLVQKIFRKMPDHLKV